MSEKAKAPAKTEKAPPASFARRDALLSIEREIQKLWAEARLFELDAPTDGEPHQEKFMITFPYPYVNGRLHLGHAFSLSKAEFGSAYQRMKGKRSLFPFGFHCTGMPIKACADKLKKEIQLYGNPPNFPDEVVEKVQEKADADDPTKFSGKKSKATAKTGSAKYQWNILASMGVPEDEIAKFAEAEYWLRYFPPLAKTDLEHMGLHVDWRRSFITTDVNPYYDSFIRWQFETLRELGKVKYGKRYTIFSPLDGQPCLDHDRAAGEGVLPQEYTIIKIEVLPPLPTKLAHLKDKRVYLAAATLRPETMYGQTNCWVLPEGDYGAYEVSPTDVYICSHRSARNMAFQGLSPEFGKPKCVAELKGTDLLGLPCKAPNTLKYDRVYALPLLTIAMNKGTGVVTSVPSDAPDDYIALMDLKNKPQLRAKYNIADDQVMPFEVVPIINIPGLGDQSAVTVCNDLKIKSQNDRDLLAKAKELTYTKGFYEGVMIVGPHTGMKVSEAKDVIRGEMVAEGTAVKYSEPNGQVISRSGDECVVCLTDQWYLNYGEDDWKRLTEECLANLETFGDETRNAFNSTLAWLREWACSRSYGLGTKLPWDPVYLIESLSDSTIYNAYYTIAHLIQGGVVDGSAVGPAGIKPEELTRPVWDYIFLGKEYPKGQTNISEETLKHLRREFDYWYPVDVRVSGKDLINNHLTFFLYNHTAIFPKEKWPKGIRSNGHLLLNGEKMSKMAGNFITLIDGVHKYSADAMRFALALAGDGSYDANFEDETANRAILRLTTNLAFFEEVLSSLDTLRTGPATLFMDRVFANEMNVCVANTAKAYDRFLFRDAVIAGFDQLQKARDTYRDSVDVMHRDLILRFIELQALLLTPVCPHFCEKVWRLLGRKGFIINELFPVAGEVDVTLERANQYLHNSIKTFRDKIERQLVIQAKAKKDGPVPKPTSAIIYVAQSFPQWRQDLLKTLHKVYLENGNKFPEDLIKQLRDVKSIAAEWKKATTVFGAIKSDVIARGLEAFEVSMPFDEKAVLEENLPFICKQLGLVDIQVALASDGTVSDPEKKKDLAIPGEPTAYFYVHATNGAAAKPPS
mmetsp:Transcript_18753/g.30824  ORF Transcript_18753/g.30824 Transcript_18753/m.30824 type:complete len:1084 (+) Transcript_18753:230-3481(+)